MTITLASSGLLWRKVTVTFDGQHVSIHKSGLGTSMSLIPLSKITSVNFVAPFASRGTIEFVAAGTDGLVSFSPWKAGQFAQLRQAVEAAL
jgi:hypothetical protein